MGQNFISLDLEMNQPSGKIIQIGACIGDIESGTIKSKLSIIIKIDEPLSEIITNLTGITPEKVNSGISLLEGYSQLETVVREQNCFRNPLTWGGGDSIELKNQLILSGLSLDSETYLFGRRWIDVKTIYQTYRLSLGKPPQGSLKTALKRVKVPSVGRHHDALVDAENTFRLYQVFVSKMRELNI